MHEGERLRLIRSCSFVNKQMPTDSLVDVADEAEALTLFRETFPQAEAVPEVLVGVVFAGEREIRFVRKADLGPLICTCGHVLNEHHDDPKCWCKMMCMRKGCACTVFQTKASP